MAIQYIDFQPSKTSAVQFPAILDGIQYNLIITWNIFGQRYYVNVYTTQGLLILSAPMVGSPIGYDISILRGKFTSALIFRTDLNRFEIMDQLNSYPDFGKPPQAMLNSSLGTFVLDQSLLGSDVLLDQFGNPVILDQTQLPNESLLDAMGAQFILGTSRIVDMTINDFFKNSVVSIVSGTGAGQQRNVVTSRKQFFTHSKYADLATWNNCSTVTTSGNQVTSTNAVDPFVGQNNNTGGALAGRTFTISCDAWIDTPDGGIPYQFLVYDGTVAYVNVSPVFNLSATRTRYSYTVTFPAGATNANFTGRLDPQSGFNVGMYFRAENWLFTEGDSTTYIDNPTASSPVVGIAVDTPWTTVPDATSIYTIKDATGNAITSGNPIAATSNTLTLATPYNVAGGGLLA